MRKQLKRLAGVALLGTALVLGMAPAAQAFEIEIVVAPNVLNIQSEGNVVTVHTDIGYWAVDAYSVHLNDLPIAAWKADSRGFFVAKFHMDAVKALDGLAIGDYNELTLIGKTQAEEAFFGTDHVLVLDNVPAGAGR